MRIIRNTVFGVVMAIGLLFSVAWLFGVPPAYITNAPAVATGIGAKLACSMRYVMDLPTEQAQRDIEVYSPILKLLAYEYNDDTRTASASIGPYSRTASWHKDLGCSLNYAKYRTRDDLYWPHYQVSDAPWPQGNEVATIAPDIQKKLEALLLEDNAQGHDTRALLVVHQGKVVGEAYSEGFDSNSRFLGWSMAKSFTGLMVGQLEMLGQLNTTDTHLFSKWQDERANISIANLLHMTDGLNYDEVYDPGQTAPAMLFQAPSASQYMLERELRDDVGDFYRYSSGSTVLLNTLVQQRWAPSTAESIRNIADNFFKPFAMHNMVFETDATGLLMGSSYVYATARDWAKLGQVMLNNGEINGKRLVREDWMARALMPNTSSNEQDYGFHVWLNKGAAEKRWPSLSENAFAAQGNRDQRVLAIPEQELVVVRLGWSKEPYRDDEVFKTISAWF